tara:strand:- start:1652 stop:2038 length:387 start_codon:yes stop_codon:yes gene_type:complete
MSFKQKFIEYLSNGMPVHIPDDEVSLFYKELSKSINNSSKQDFKSTYLKIDDCVVISDKFIDYLKVSYINNKVIFRTTDHTKDQFRVNREVARKMGEAFLIVYSFIEKALMKESSNQHNGSSSDNWAI